MVTLEPQDPAGLAFRAAVGSSLDAFLAARGAELAGVDDALTAFTTRAQTFTGGGKRLRPAFCAWGYAAATGTLEIPDAVVAAAASLDLLHVSALVHDDVMDASDFRRGIPAAHRQFEADHRAASSRGDAEAFGRAAAILFGDMLLVWSEQAFQQAGLEASAHERALPYLHAVRQEVTAGQYLDTLAQAVDPRTRAVEDVTALEALVNRVVTFKTASYSIQRPLNIGAALGGASDGQQRALDAFGLPLGRAYQWRDDVLGVFGDESLTGKESGEDLREGKLTLLVVRTLASASDAAARRFADLFGRADLDATAVEELRGIITETGALRVVEDAIASEQREALDALAGADLAPAVRAGFERLADLAVARSF